VKRDQKSLLILVYVFSPRAIADFTKAIPTESSAREGYANRGIILLLQRYDADAQKDFDKALKLDGALNPGFAEPN
jgi:hypothetical protein